MNLNYPTCISYSDIETEHPLQDKLVQSEADADQLSKEGYERINDKTTAAGFEHGINRTLREHNVDIIIGPADGRLPDVLALASEFIAFCVAECLEINAKFRMPSCDTSARVS